MKEEIKNRIHKNLGNEMDLLFKNKFNKISNKINKKNNLFNSNWNQSSNLKLKTYTDDKVLYKNTFMKNTPLKDQIINDYNKPKRIFLPDIKSPNMKIDKINININLNNNKLFHFRKISKDNSVNNININNDNKNELFCDKESIFRNIKFNKIINKNNNINETDAQTTQSATNSIKNQTSSKNIINQNINDDIHNYEVGLLSAGSTSNNTIMIPILKMKRPMSNVEKIINNNYEININKGKNNKSENKEGFEFMNIQILHNSRNKKCRSKEIKRKFNLSMKNQNVFNIISDVQKLIPNFHKIKIEKGMINNNKLINSFSNKITCSYKSKNNSNNYQNNNIFKSIDY